MGGAAEPARHDGDAGVEPQRLADAELQVAESGEVAGRGRAPARREHRVHLGLAGHYYHALSLNYRAGDEPSRSLKFHN